MVRASKTGIAMHGLINRSIQCFIRDTYGHKKWDEITARAGLGFSSFEALLSYADELSYRVMDVASEILATPRETLLEDMGTYIVTHPNLEPVRRILRFGGETFLEFLLSLDDLRDRARMAVPDLCLPRLEVRETPDNIVTFRCAGACQGFGYVLMGLLRAMADDYGALVLLEHKGVFAGQELVSVQLLDMGFSAGRAFQLAPARP